MCEISFNLIHNPRKYRYHCTHRADKTGLRACAHFDRAHWAPLLHVRPWAGSGGTSIMGLAARVILDNGGAALPSVGRGSLETD